MKWLNVLEVLKPQTKVCKLCFKKFRTAEFFGLFSSKSSICSSCQEKLKPTFETFEVEGVKGLSIYSYDEEIKSLIYQFKGCFDYEIYDVFLQRYESYLNLKYKKFMMVPAPSFSEANEKRGFNHVECIFKNLKIPLINLFVKTENIKQANLNFKERKQINNIIKIKENNCVLKGKKILLIDDIFTTGNTMKTMINLIRKCEPKEIQVLVIAKTHL